MAARYISSQLIQSVHTGTKSIAVEYVDKTTSWIRPQSFPSLELRLEFLQVAEANTGSLKPETTRLAMKYASQTTHHPLHVNAYYHSNRESEHQSPLDMRKHYTAFELDKDGTVIGVQHLVKGK